MPKNTNEPEEKLWCNRTKKPEDEMNARRKMKALNKYWAHLINGTGSVKKQR